MGNSVVSKPSTVPAATGPTGTGAGVSVQGSGAAPARSAVSGVTVSPEHAALAKQVNLDRVVELVRKQIVQPSVVAMADQQATLKRYTPTPKRPDMHFVSEGFASSAVSGAVPQDLMAQIVQIIVQELLHLFGVHRPDANASPLPRGYVQPKPLVGHTQAAPIPPGHVEGEPAQPRRLQPGGGVGQPIATG